MKTNTEILNNLKANRDVSEFAKFLGITPQGLYKLLENQSQHKNQYGNYMAFLRNKYERKVNL